MGLHWEPEFWESRPSISSYVSSSSPSSSSSSYGMVKELRSARAEMTMHQNRGGKERKEKNKAGKERGRRKKRKENKTCQKKMKH